MDNIFLILQWWQNCHKSKKMIELCLIHLMIESDEDQFDNDGRLSWLCEISRYVHPPSIWDDCFGLLHCNVVLLTCCLDLKTVVRNNLPKHNPCWLVCLNRKRVKKVCVTIKLIYKRYTKPDLSFIIQQKLSDL